MVEVVATFFIFFFFSSRRRHTRLQGDWSSDVCSSDLAKVRAIPGVESAALGWDLPICCSGQSPISFASRPRTDEGRLPLLNVAVVDPEYFETLQIPLVSGRHIETGDRAGQPLVALVSERVAQKFFAGASPIGERLRLGGQVNDTSSWRTIVGVVRDTRTDGLTEAPRGTLYLPRAQEKMRDGWVIVRNAQPAEQTTAQLRRALAEVDRNVPLERVQTMDAALAVEDRKSTRLNSSHLVISYAV